MSTLDLAKKLGFVTVIKPPESTDAACPGQELEYLLVIDFEATCWGDDSERWKGQEIIEFPCVLLHLASGQQLATFQQYVRPTVRPVLSPFCKNLTGIRQSAVDVGIPLPQCLELFTHWIQSMQRSHCFTLPYGGASSGNAALVTWSDWDFQKCLQLECRRKNITIPDIFNSWIDLKAKYMDHYRTSGSGLAASMASVGIKFEGREHCGLTDATNTATLAAHMARHGCVLAPTSVLSSKVLKKTPRK